jgi:Planctomycete cytochrome C/WD domain, G-beta repeat
MGGLTRRFRRILAATIVVLLATAEAAPAAGEENPTFERDIKPLFAKRCAVCHNQKKLGDPDVSGGLALDTFEVTLAGTPRHKVIVPGKAAESELVRRLSVDDEDERMPLSEKPLPDPQRDLVRRWIDAGAPRGVVLAEPAVAPSGPQPIRKVIRSLDVVLPTETTALAGAAGPGPGGAVQVALRIGPLPAVSALALRGDGQQLAVGMHGEVVVWDLPDARPALTLRDIPGPVHALAFSRDDRRLAVGAGLPARTGSVRVYSVPDGSLFHDFEGHGDAVFGLDFRPDDGQLASASFDQSVRLWDLIGGRPAGVFTGHSDFVYDVAYTPDGRSLLSVSKDRSIKRIDLATLKEQRTYSDHDDDVLAVAVQPGGVKFVTAGNEPQLRWWTLDAEKPAMRAAGHGGPVHQLSFSGDGRRLISAGGDSSVRLWDGSSGAFLRALPGPSEWQYAATLSGDGRLAAAGGWDGLVRVWDAENGKLLATLIQPPSPNPSRPEWLAMDPVGHLTASPELLSLVRWRVGGAEVPPDLPRALFVRPNEVARSLRGEPGSGISFERKD